MALVIGDYKSDIAFFDISLNRFRVCIILSVVSAACRAMAY